MSTSRSAFGSARVAGGAALVRARIEESIAVERKLLADAVVATIERIAGDVADVLARGGKVLLCGNGGSAADAAHLAGELVGRFSFERAPLPALSLADAGASLTAIANDYGYGQGFARQVRAFGQPGDVLIALSTSGESESVLEAVDAAHAIGMRSVGLTGSPGGRLAAAADVCLRVPSERTARIQEAHMLVGHTICELVERALFPSAR